MGYGFPLECTNLVAYMTDRAGAPPRVGRGLVENLLGAMVHGEEGRPVLFSPDPEWIARLQQLAAASLQRLPPDYTDGEAEAPPEQVKALLDPLKQEFSRFSLYAMTVDELDNADSTRQLKTAAQFLAESGSDVLVLFPSVWDGWQTQVLDPFPSFALALAHANQWPGLLVWNPAGATAFVPAAEANPAVREMIAALRQPGQIDKWLAQRRWGPTGKRLLHLSDLHFGSRAASRNLPLLEVELFDVVKSVERVVITGDLFDNPEQSAANAFHAFRSGLGRLAGEDPIVVPGNHDQRILGNVGQLFKQAANLNFRNHVVDDRLGVTFLCFNSAEAGSFARGRVTADQFTRVAADWRNAIAMRPEVGQYLPVVLVHHHPFSFHTKPRTWLQRALARVGLDDEPVLEMENAREFVEWCARWRAPIVLHGHKHQARFIEEDVAPGGAPSTPVSAIGCGSSLGAEGSGVSYNIVQWDARRERWVASFFESVQSGPFVQKAVMVERRQAAA